MKFMQRFSFSRQSPWMGVLMAVVLIAAPLYASDEPIKAGEITGIDLVARVIKVNNIRYILAQKAEIYNVSGEEPRAMDITDLKVGQQVVGFEAASNVISGLRIFIKPVEVE